MLEGGNKSEFVHGRYFIAPMLSGDYLVTVSCQSKVNHILDRYQQCSCWTVVEGRRASANDDKRSGKMM